jgi:peroxiredoxin
MKKLVSFVGCLTFLAGGSPVLGAEPNPDPATAQNESPELAPGHSSHGEAFNEGPRQAARLMPGMPKISFAVTTTNDLTQKFFTQGVGQLHGFWYFEAERSFRQAAVFDTNCAMAYWGLAMANINNAARAKEFIKIAAAKKETAGKREVLWIDSLAEYYNDADKDEKERRRQYIRALEKIVYEHPDDIEAKAFLAFHVWENSGKGLPITSAQSVESLLKEIFAVDPMHPAHHYRIHLWDGEKEEMAVRAIPSASRCGQSSPGIAHLWHMPGHTFSKLKRYHDAAWQQEAAVRVDNAQLIADRILPDQIHNYAHNSEWLCQTYGRIGRARDAIDLSKNMIEMPHHPRFNTMDKKEDNTLYEKSSGSAFHGRRRLIEELMRYELWEDLIALSDTPYLPPTDIAEEQARRARALGVAFFSNRNLKDGRAQIDALEQAAKLMRGERQAAVEKAEEKARESKEPSDKINRAMLDAMNNFTDRLQTIENHVAELKVYQALAEDKPEAVRESLEAAKDISKERRAQIHLKLDDKEKAETLAREAYEGGTNQVQLIANYADVLRQCDKSDKAVEIFKELKALSSAIDLEMPVFRRLQPITQELNLPADWRVAAASRQDSGERPEIATLGPFRWEPSPAPDWTLPDGDGKQRSLRKYRGKPVLVVFYLGRGCTHCIEQLNAFTPMTKAFAEAGISIVAISTDSTDGLKKTPSKTDEPFPFPLVSDEKLDVFKVYRAFDDFESMPLHGIFLVDGDGLVRWQDIGYEPFKETAFLLVESRRLLAFPAAKNRSKTLTDTGIRAKSPATQGRR